MTKRLKQAVVDALEAWGIRLSPAPMASKRLEVLLPIGEENVEVGFLSVENGEFAFRYSSRFRARALPPIPEFPDIDAVYRSPKLWPFFEERIPPIEREDVRHLIEDQRLDESDRLALLEALGKRTIASPYIVLPSPG